MTRVPFRAGPPKNVPSGNDSEVDWVIKDINDATGRGSKVEIRVDIIRFSPVIDPFKHIKN